MEQAIERARDKDATAARRDRGTSLPSGGDETRSWVPQPYANAWLARAEPSERIHRRVRMTIIGAGSAVFSLRLVKDLCLTPSLAGSEVVFMDIDSERLQAITNLAQRYASEIGTDVHFEQTAVREASLRDTEFVIDTSYASGHDRAVRLRETTARHGGYYSNAGIYGPVDQWGFDDLQLRLDLAHDMERLCPDAWLLESGNPVYEGCTLLARETSVKVVGICHEQHDILDVCRALNLDPQQVTWQATGLNHQIWLTHFLYKGEDAYPLLDEWVASEAVEYWRSHVNEHTHDIQMSRAAINLYHLFGLMPIGDTIRDPINWWFHTDFDTKRHWFGDPFGGPDTEFARSKYVEILNDRMREIARIAADPSAHVSEAVGTEPSTESHISIVDALATGSSGFYQVNVPNQGALAAVPHDVVVEVPAYIDRTGVHPLRVTPLPRKVMLEQIMPRILEMERDLEAFKTGDRSILLWNVLMDRSTRSYELAMTILDDVLQMEGHEALAAHHTWRRLVPGRGRDA